MSAAHEASTALVGGATIHRGEGGAGTREVTLRAGDLWSMEVHGGTIDICCLSGALWVTGEDRVDHVLQAGESLRAPLRVRLVITALRPARLRACWGEESKDWMLRNRLLAGLARRLSG